MRVALEQFMRATHFHTGSWNNNATARQGTGVPIDAGVALYVANTVPQWENPTDVKTIRLVLDFEEEDYCSSFTIPQNPHPLFDMLLLHASVFGVDAHVTHQICKAHVKYWKSITAASKTNAKRNYLALILNPKGELVKQVWAAWKAAGLNTVGLDSVFDQ
jgi:hypothetical protein